MISKEKCSGCSACENICPTNAITLKIDNLTGFKLAEIDTTKCINCGKCDSVCPHNTFNLHDTLEQKRYVMKSTDDEVLKNSSSGGAFTIITKPLLEQGWKVVGVRWNKEWHAEYAIAATIEEWEKFRKSKYMQADTNNIYIRVKELLDNGDHVVFIGIPCHVSGLLNFLGKAYDNLLTVDLLCNSLPSPKIWDEWYKYEGLDKSTFTHIDMRPKLSVSCRNLFLQLKKNNDNIHNILMSTTPIWGLTLGGHLTTLDICGECKYKCYERVSDITIGDLWNGNKECPELWNKMDSNLSSCMANTTKGQNILKNIKCDYICKQINNVKLPANFKAKNSFEQFKNIDKLGLDKFLDKFIKKDKEKEFPYDIALCGGTLNNNFGATLTYYALYKYLESLNYKTVIIPPMAKKDRGGMDEGNVFEKYCNIAPNYFAQGKPGSFNDLADTFMVGSDQTWKSTIIGRLGLKPFLNYVNYKKNKIVYGVSYGTTNESAYNKHPQFVDELRRLVNKFDYISHREKEGCDITKNWYYRNDSVHCIDPVFLVDINEYEKLVDESNVTLPNNDYLCFYALSRPIEAYNFVHELSKELNCDEIIIGNGLKNSNNKQREKFPDENYVNPILAQDWLKYIKNCKCLITDSFHGVCFAILFNKPFICLKPIKDIRINWLLKCAELEENYMEILDTNKAKYLINKNINVKHKFNEFIDFSKAWLDDCLFKMGKKKIEKNNKVALCVISKQEDRYLKEYVEHYKSIGFNNILFYDNNELDDNKQYDVLKSYIDEGFVIYNDWRGKQGNRIQKGAYEDCAKKYKEKYDWIAFFDADEFLELVEHKTIQDFLNSNEKFNDFDGVSFNWMLYQDNGLVYNDGRTLKERFDVENNGKKSSVMKTIIKTNALIEKCKTVHIPMVKFFDKICFTNGEPRCDGKDITLLSLFEPKKLKFFDKAYIKHYKYKTIEETINRLNRGDCNPRRKYNNKTLKERVLHMGVDFFTLNKATEEKIKVVLDAFPEYANEYLDIMIKKGKIDEVLYKKLKK